jgi:hypothetical protein
VRSDVLQATRISAMPDFFHVMVRGHLRVHQGARRGL